jgi:hypothetical protein
MSAQDHNKQFCEEFIAAMESRPPTPIDPIAELTRVSQENELHKTLWQQRDKELLEVLADAVKIEDERNALKRSLEECMEANARVAERLRKEQQRAERAEQTVATLNSQHEMWQKRGELAEARLHWLHDCSNGTTDTEGYEWGIYRVKWVNGKAEEVWATASDFSDLDAEMEREARAAIDAAKGAHP